MSTKEEIDALSAVLADEALDRDVRLSALSRLAGMPAEAQQHMHPAIRFFLPGPSLEALAPEAKLSATCEMRNPDGSLVLPE